MLLTLLLCAAADDTFNGLKASEWIAMVKDDPLPRKRKAAIAALGQLVNDKSRDTVLPPVAKAMRADNQAGVRLQAALVLAQQPVEWMAAHLPDLTEGLRDEKDPAVKREQAVALGRLGKAAQAAVLPLIDALKDAPPVRAAAAEALGRIGSGANSAAPSLVTLLNDSDRSVVAAAAFALGRIDAADPEAVSAALIQILKSARAADQVRSLQAALHSGVVTADRPNDILGNAVVSLGLLGVKTPDAAKTLAALLTDPDTEIRQQAVLALGKLAVAAKPAEAELRLVIKSDSDAVVRTCAVHALAAASANEPDTMIVYFGERLRSEPEPEVRLAMVEELGGTGTAALNILREAQRDTQVKVREAATAAIKRINKPKPSTMP